MNIHIYRQADSRWASLPYPGKGYNFGPNACGACAVLHCIIEMDKYKNWTPKDIQPYMKQFATYGSGTTWAGIQKALVHYGLKDVANIPTMPQLWRELEKGNRVGVLLFGSTKGPDGTVWTTGGHYIAFTGYRVKNGQHQLYLKDSGGRKHDGWYSYERSMKGDVRQVWVGRLPNGHEVKESEQKATPAPTTNGKLTVDGIGGATTIKALQKYLKVSASDGVLSGQNKSFNKYYPSVKSVTYGSGGSATVKALQKWVGTSADGVWGQGTSKALQKKLGVTADGIFGTNSMKALQKFLNNNTSGTTSSTTSKTTTTTTKTSTTSTTSTTKTTTPANFRENVIDISYVQSKTIDWKKVKADGIDGAIIRCGYRGYGSGALNEDSMFMNHITGANKAGLKLGIYFFTEAINAAEGKAEAQFAIKMLKKAGVKLTYPIAIDTENINASNPVPRANSNKLSTAKRTEAIKAFCEEIKANGYEPMIYASTSWLNNQLDMSKLPYTVWVAQYNDKVTYKGKYAIWQYTSTAKINGINQVVDKNYCYVNYSTSSSVVAKAETVTTTTPSTTTKVALKSVDIIAQEVLDGKWGSGQTRKDKLTAAGYNYDAVQKKVNELVTANQSIIDKLLTACQTQAEYMQNYVYGWESNPTITKSKTKGTCVTYVACVLQRIGILESGKFIWQNGTGFGTGKVYGDNSKMIVIYTNNKTFTALKDQLQKGDIVILDDNKSGNQGGGGHIMIFAGKWSSDGHPYVWDNQSCNRVHNGQTGIHTYNKDRKILAIARLKTGDLVLKPIEVVAQEVLDGKWSSGTTRKNLLIAAGYDYDKVQAKVNELLKPKTTVPTPTPEPTPEPTPDYTKEEEMANTIIAQFTKDSIVKIIELLQTNINKPEPTPEPIPEPTPQPVVAQKYTGTLPTITLKKTNAQVISDAIVWAKWIAGDNSFHYGYGDHSHHNGCYFCGTQPKSKKNAGILDYEKTYCCNPFVGAAWAHGGGDSKAWELCHKGTSWDFHANAGYATSSLFKNLGHPAKSTLKAGDVLCKDTHVALYIGDGYLVEAAGSDDNKRNSTKWNNSISISKLTDSRYKGFLRVHRYIGNVNTTRPIYYGDVSYRVKDLQKYLNWYFGKEVCTVDGVFGDGTLKYVKAFQVARKLTADGIVGSGTIAEMGKVTK